MQNHIVAKSAHASFPLSSPALQSASLHPAYQYFEINYARELSARLDRLKLPYSSGELAAIGLIGKVFLAIIRHFQHSPGTFYDLDNHLLEELGASPAQKALVASLRQFPTSLIFDHPDQIQAYSFTAPDSASFRHSYYYSLILILVAENNPALRSRDGLFTDQGLRSSGLFPVLSNAIHDFYRRRSDAGPRSNSLLDMLLEPGRLHPNSIYDQLRYVSKEWSEYIDASLLRSVIIGLDQLQEEVIPATHARKSAQDPLGHLEIFSSPDIDQINFSPDKAWMPLVVLQAKNAFVWLDQLSREYQRPITRLDQIPDDELLKISRRGINALWLIGLWERSPASQKIKQLCGNPDAVSSAYSLYDYTIAEDLGGEEAYRQLSASAARVNIRLAADMVPNHMGIDSRWVTDHPDWFLSLDSPPFPGYTFEGPNLSSNPAARIYLEDHYYDRSDAAVVFKSVAHSGGQTRYIYHGNDGTSMPWNDTAQLDYLNPQVREAVIQTILHVARKFPIIRFDAAMTLSKKHYQRLWFPEPGTGGAIPTRAGFGLSKDEFDTKMPEEFWRELVDRIAEEVPDTLLLAEAFWMMEGYFVRSLGMHRVYNSAFMHMLRDEDNKKYRKLLISTLEYDPQILKRYVNFMNNPDEETALSQFGSGGKYFGTCLIMSTLPGLPMFGHGQIEGLAEKYGMEYRKAYFDESPDPVFVERHQQEIFPLLHKRYLFSGVDNFTLYDFTKLDNSVSDDVLAYSNRSGSENGLIVFHNKWGDIKGRIKDSTLINGCSTDLLAGLGISFSEGDFIVFRDQISGLEYIRSVDDLSANGLFLELGAYDYRAYVDFRTEIDQDGNLAALCETLETRGSPNLHKDRLAIKYSPLIEPVVAICADWKERLVESSHPSGQSIYQFFSSIFPGQLIDIDLYLELLSSRVSCLVSLLSNAKSSILSSEMYVLLPWILLSDLSSNLSEEDLEMLLNLISTSLADLDFSNTIITNHLYKKVSLPFYLSSILEKTKFDDPITVTNLWLSDPYSRQFTNIHEHEGTEWFHKESMEFLIKSTYLLNYLAHCSTNDLDLSLPDKKAAVLFSNIAKALQALDESEYQVEQFAHLLVESFSGESS